MRTSRIIYGLQVSLLAAIGTVVGLASAKAATNWTNLVSDIPGVAHYPDSNLIDPMGIVPLPGGTLVVADHATGMLSVYEATKIAGDSKFSKPETITLPPGESGTASPTGLVWNPKAYVAKSSTTSFVVSGTASQMLVATDEGTVFGVNLSGSAATLAFTSTNNAVYKGIALSGTGGGNGQMLYLANFGGGTVDVLNESFQPVTLTATTSYTFDSNPATQAGCKPFNIKAFSLRKGGTTFNYLFVTYMVPGSTAEGNGYILAFDPRGNYKGVITTGSALASTGTTSGATTTDTGASVVSSPWGMAMLHSEGGGKLFVGNVADGTIQTFEIMVSDTMGDITSTPGGPLIDVEGNIFQIQNLRGLHFGPREQWTAFVLDADQLVEDTGTLYFSAGIADGAHGLVGKITNRQVIDLPLHYKFHPVVFKLEIP